MSLKTQYTKLNNLHADIENRVQAIRAEQPDWLCRRGCDACCHRLSDVPRLTAPEWALLKEGLSALPPALLAQIRQDIAALANNATRPIVCPMLDKTAGSCRVYPHRPIACRTYGFYVQRDLGLYCQDIETQVTGGALAAVVWGNHDVIDARLAALGESRELTDWLADWQA